MQVMVLRNAATSSISDKRASRDTQLLYVFAVLAHGQEDCIIHLWTVCEIQLPTTQTEEQRKKGQPVLSLGMRCMRDLKRFTQTDLLE